MKTPLLRQRQSTKNMGRNNPHRGLSAVLSSSASGMLAIVAGILLLPLIVTTVGSGPYGVWLVLVSVATYLQLTDFGVGSALVHFGSRARGGDRFEASLASMLGAALLWNAAAGLVALTVFLAIGLQYVSSPDVTRTLVADQGVQLVVLGAVALGSIFMKPFDSVLVGEGKLPLERRHVFIGLIARIVGTLIGCIIFDSIVVVAIAEVIGLVLPSLLSMAIVLVKVTRPRIGRQSLDTLRFLMKFSLRSFATGAVGMLTLQAGTIIVALVATSSAVTYFNAAFRIYTGVRQVFAWTTDPFRTMLAKTFVLDGARGRQIVMVLGFNSLLIASVACVVFGFVAPTFVRVWLGSSVPVDEIAATIMVLLVGVVLNAIHVQFVPSADALGRPGAFFYLQGLWLVMFVVVGGWLGSLFGIVGVAAGLTLPLLVVEPLYVWKASRVIGFSIPQWARSTVLPVAMIVIPSLAVAVVIDLAVRTQLGSMIAAGAFVGLALCMIYLSRKRPPISDIPTLLRTEI